MNQPSGSPRAPGALHSNPGFFSASARAAAAARWPPGPRRGGRLGDPRGRRRCRRARGDQCRTRRRTNAMWEERGFGWCMVVGKVGWTENWRDGEDVSQSPTQTTPRSRGDACPVSAVGDRALARGRDQLHVLAEQAARVARLAAASISARRAASSSSDVQLEQALVRVDGDRVALLAPARSVPPT